MGKKIKDVIFILVLGSVSTLLLLGIKSYTYPIISRYEELQFKSTILDAANIAYAEGNIDEIFNKDIRELQKDDLTYYLSPDNFYIFEFNGRGLWGLMRGIVTLHPDFETIKSIRIISQEETPGLGARITEKQFLDQFENKKIAPNLEVALRRKATRDNEIDAISGASMTSVALIEMINDSVNEMRRIIKD